VAAILISRTTLADTKRRSEVAALPDSFLRDPADRIIVASAHVHGAALLTNDRRIPDAALVTTI